MVKLSSIPVRTATTLALMATLGLLTACATPKSSQPVAERLDPDTATTVTVIKKPIELVGAGAHGPTGNPFAFIAPFETDRMGKRALYLWVSAPATEGAPHRPQLVCDGHALALPPVDGDVSHMGLSNAPYPAPVPWDTQWYFQLSQDDLDCMATAQIVSVETYGANGAPSRFTAEAKDLAALKEFTSH